MKQEYTINPIIAHDNYVYVKIKKGMYGLKQAAIIAYKHLVKKLQPHGYYPVPSTSNLWAHTSRPTVFVLCVDDFGIKYFNQKDLDHLLNALKQTYKVSIDLEGKNYLGYELFWNYAYGYVDLAMPKYIPKALRRFNHPQPKRPQYAPHKWTEPTYGQRVQYVQHDNSSSLKKDGTRLVQQINGTVLYYAQAMDSTMLPACNEISYQQAAPTTKTMEACRMLLDYAATYPNAKIGFHASDMILHIASDAAYLVLPNAKSRVSGHYYLSNKTIEHPSITPPPNNGPILTMCNGIKKTVSSAAESETHALFRNGQNAIPLRVVLQALGHPQPPTPIETDNKTAEGFTKQNIKLKKSKSWDMRYHWLRDQQTHKQLDFYWRPGKTNRADYFTKHHPPTHHLKMRPHYILKNFIMKMKSRMSS